MDTCFPAGVTGRYVRTAISRLRQREKKEIGQTDTEIEEALFMKEEKSRVRLGGLCGRVRAEAKDYRVMAGKNFVGRADDMDIQILGDNKISRRNHCVIVYDEKQSKTVLLPGDSNGIVYLNGEAVYAPAQLHEV